MRYHAAVIAEKANQHTHGSSARGNCGLSLNSPEGRGSVADLKTCDNDSDAALTPKGGRDLRVSDKISVLNQRGNPIMPCNPRKARLLLATGKAIVVSGTPFVVRLTLATGETKQPIILGDDSGYLHIGLSVVLEKEEVYSADVMLRSDMVKLNSERRSYRRTRRNRGTWYRPARFDNRKKPEGWLAPSIQHKLDSNIKVIEAAARLLPISDVVIEVASFDIQKIKNPDISGTDYQNGEQSGFLNVREYVLYCDGHKCVHCKGKSKDRRLHVHHKESRQTGGDRPDNLVTLCETCHDKHHKGEIVLKHARPAKGFKAETFMTMVRWRLVEQLRALGFNVRVTYGYETKSRRIALDLDKSHVNDAFVIAGGETQDRTSNAYVVRQVRKCNRKLFKGDRSHIKNTAPKEVFGFRQWDKVSYNGQELFIKGRRLRGAFALSGIDGKLVCETSYKNLTLLERARTLLIQKGTRIPLHPNLTIQDGVPCVN